MDHPPQARGGIEVAASNVPLAEPGRRRAIVVLGMHRSGTSAITRVCSLLGADLPRNLLPADSHNEPGYWEPQSVKVLNDELLASVGSSWDDTMAFPEAWYGTPAEEEFRHRAVQTLTQEYGNSEIFVLKDPRICRLVPLWFSALKGIGADAVFILSLRNPLEVAASLEKRDGLSQSHSLLLWLRHVLDAEIGSRGSPRCVVLYDELLANPGRAISEFSAKLPVAWPRALAGANGAIDDFLRQGLRHHRFSERDLGGISDVSRWVEETYFLLRTQFNSSAAESRFDTLRDVLDCAALGDSPMPGVPDSEPNESRGEARRLGAAASGGVPAEAQSSETAESSVGSLVARIGELEAKTALLQRAMQDESAVSRLSRRVSVQDGRVRQLESALREATKRTQEESHRAEDLDAELARRNELLQKLQEKLAFTEVVLEGRNREARYLLGQIGILRSSLPRGIRSSVSLSQRIMGALLALTPFRPREFNPDYYLARYSDVAAAGYHPLVHFLLFGRKEGRRCTPVEATFSAYEDMALIQEGGLFDEKYYAARNPDVVAAGRDPIEHFLLTGAWESRMPSPKFDPVHYLESYPDVRETGINPLVHYLRSGRFGGRSPLRPGKEWTDERLHMDVPRQPTAEEELQSGQFVTDIRLISFYLPQFHPFPENDRFWGKGFTEWTNVTRATPAFRGHYQPRLPGELGFYDLRVREVQRRQIEMAKAHGIHGFCYHYYWFNGKPIMEGPLQQMLEDPTLDLPFCLHWANEPWTSSWDGCNQKGILLDQSHTPEDDMAFIRGIQRALADARYIRVNGRPLLAIYRPGLFPDMKATVDRWRNFCVKEGIGELYLVATQQPFDGPIDPRKYDFDAAVEFPPHNLPMVDASDQVELYDSGFAGRVCSYPEIVRASLEKPVPDYKLFRGIMPGFDATSRRRDSAIYVGNDPEIYQRWLEGLCSYTRKNLPADERLVFINAWNEWAEGAYLEPDSLHGYAFLNRTSRALRKFGRGGRLRKVVFLGHDAARAGSQVLLLDLVRWITEKTSTDVRLILGRGGELLEAYRGVADVLILDGLTDLPATDREARIAAFVGTEADLIYANTVASGEYLPSLEFLRAPIITHIHELEKSIRKFASPDALRTTLRLSEKFIAASQPVAENLAASHGVDLKRIETICSFIQTRNHEPDATARAGTRRLLRAGAEDVVVFGCGTRDWRKAPDLFVEIAGKLLGRGLFNFRFFWIGAQVPGQYPDLESGLASRGLGSHVSFLGESDFPRDYFAAGDIFLLPSREDPFPLVCLEAAECGLPTICFADSGGMPGFVESDAGVVVPYEDVDAMTGAVAQLIKNPQQRERLGSTARRKLRERHTSDVAMPAIFRVMRDASASPPLVSVIIPSYNYGQYIEKRLESIFSQTFQDLEIIIEDDCSTDGTLDLLAGYESRPNLRVVRHDENQGVFAMWSEGLKAAAGRIIWIAEEDDLCEPEFLEKLLPFFDDDRVQLAYCQSAVIDEDGATVGDYTHCFPELSETKWTESYVQPIERELLDGLAIKNFILNASGVLFRKPDVDEASRLLRMFSLSADWFLYLHVLEGGHVAYCPEKLNYHRRHAKSLIGKQADLSQLIAEAGEIHRHLQRSRPFDEEFVRQMSLHWMAVWRGRNPDEPEHDFWKIYGDPRPQEFSEASAMSREF